MQLEPTIGFASRAAGAHERAPPLVASENFVFGLGFDRRAARRNFERSPILRATRLRDWIAAPKVSPSGGCHRCRKAFVAPALCLERLHSL